MKEAELIRIITMYSYLGIIFYYSFLDFISPLSDEISVITFAYLAKMGLINIFGVSAAIFVGLIIKNLMVFFISNHKFPIVERLKQKHPDSIRQFNVKMNKHFFKTIFLLTFIPQARIFAPIVAGFGHKSKIQYALNQAIIIILFIAIYFPLGVFFYKEMNTVFDELNGYHGPVYWIIYIAIIIVISYGIGRYFFRKRVNN